MTGTMSPSLMNSVSALSGDPALRSGKAVPLLMRVYACGYRAVSSPGATSGFVFLAKMQRVSEALQFSVIIK
jgi:hypothetical protein